MSAKKEPSESIWNIPPGKIPLYLLLFVLLTLIGIVAVAFSNNNGIVGIYEGIGKVGFASAIAAYVVVRFDEVLVVIGVWVMDLVDYYRDHLAQKRQEREERAQQERQAELEQAWQEGWDEAMKAMQAKDSDQDGNHATSKEPSD